MRIALIANEASGGGFDPEPLVATMRRHGADVSVCGPDPEDLDVVPSWEPERIAMAGGDGTIGGCAELAGRLAVPLAVIPMGTANDFARTADLPLDPEEACVLAATGAWGLRRGTIAEQRDVCHARGHVIEVDLPPGTEFNVDGEVHDDGMQRITVARGAFELVVG